MSEATQATALYMALYFNRLSCVYLKESGVTLPGAREIVLTGLFEAYKEKPEEYETGV